MMVGDRVGEEAAVEQLTKVEGEEEVEIKVADHLIELIMAVAVNKQIRIKEEEVAAVVEGVEATGDHGTAVGNQLPHHLQAQQRRRRTAIQK